MSTTTQEVTPQQRIAILKHLAGGKDLDTVAVIMRGISRDQVGDIARHHGYPDTDKLSWAVDVLVGKEEEAAKDSIPTSTPPRIPVATPPAAAAADTASLTKPDEILVLLNTAKSHPSKKIQNAADRAFDYLDKLRALMREDQEKNAEKRKAAAEKAAAKAEVDRLEEQLREAKAKLRGTTATKPAPGNRIDDTGSEPSAKTIRAWAAENDLDCPTRGQVPKSIRDAYDEAHQDAA